MAGSPASVRHLCSSCTRLRDGACSVRAPAAEKLLRGETVHACALYVGKDGRRELTEGADGGHSAR